MRSSTRSADCSPQPRTPATHRLQSPAKHITISRYARERSWKNDRPWRHGSGGRIGERRLAPREPRMKPPKRVEEPAPAPVAHQAEHLLRFGDLELDRHSVVVRGPRGDIELGLSEFRACALLVEAAGATVRWAELAAVTGVDLRYGRHALELTCSRLRSHLLRRGRSTVTVAATRGVGWRLVATGTVGSQSQRLCSSDPKSSIQALASPESLPNQSSQP